MQCYLFQNHLVGFIEKIKFSIKPWLRAYDYAQWLGLSQHSKEITKSPFASWIFPRHSHWRMINRHICSENIWLSRQPLVPILSNPQVDVFTVIVWFLHLDWLPIESMNSESLEHKPDLRIAGDRDLEMPPSNWF